jgi:hypothetical protein
MCHSGKPGLATVVTQTGHQAEQRCQAGSVCLAGSSQMVEEVKRLQSTVSK